MSSGGDGDELVSAFVVSPPHVMHIERIGPQSIALDGHERQDHTLTLGDCDPQSSSRILTLPEGLRQKRRTPLGAWEHLLSHPSPGDKLNRRMAEGWRT